MNFAIAFHAADREQFERWSAWVQELGGMGQHSLFVMPAKGVPMPNCSLPHTVVRDSYGIVTNWAGNDTHRDAAGANSMLRQFAWFFSDKGPFMFIEPDCIPLRPGWHDEWAAEYVKGARAFMGAKIGGVPGQYPTHSTGNMVLPQNACHIPKLMMGTFSPNGFEVAFDVAAAEQVLANFHNTVLIQQIFRGESFATQDDLNRIRPEACLFHNSKDGSLIERLRERWKGMTKLVAPVQDLSEVVIHGSVTFIPKGQEVQFTKPIVHTFCSWSADFAYRQEQEKVVALWLRNWVDAGWDARILTDDDAKKHPEYERFRAGFEKLPTINPREYEQAAWMRHVAMAAVGGGLLVDYDTLINGFQNEE